MDVFENYFAGLRNKSIAVLGLGVSNRPLVRLLLEFGCDVVGCDKTPREKLDDEVLALEAAGCKLTDVVKTTCFLADMADFPHFNEVYGKYFTEKPARSCVAVKTLPKNVLCEVEAIAEVK